MRSAVALAMVIATGCGRIGFDSVCGLVGPCVYDVAINDNATYAIAPRLAVRVHVSGDAPLEVRVAEPTGTCQDAYADDRWEPYVESATIRAVVEPTDGTKQLCVWARDRAGDVSVIDRELRGANMATIQYETENQPRVDVFSATVDGNRLALAWTVADAEGLVAGPADLEYTVDDVEHAAWLPLAAGLGDASGTGTADLALPTTAPFFVRLTPRDRAGNRGVPAVSTALNVPGWSVYLGSRDRGIGASARAARLRAGDVGQTFAIDPDTLDVYATDAGHGIVRVDGASGLVERMFEYGAPNLPDTGALPAAPVVRDGTTLAFDAGRLYLSIPAASPDTDSGAVYQIDPATRQCRRYLGGGTAIAAGATAATVYAVPWVFTFDEDGSMYFLTSCAPGTVTSARRMLKATRLGDGTAGAISVVAGNCGGGALPDGGPYDPLVVPMQGFPYASLGSIAVGDHGRLIYFGSYPGDHVWKIVDGQLWSSSAVTSAFGAIAYDRTSDTLYEATRTGVTTVRPNRTGAVDTVIGTIGTSSGAGTCTADGTAKADACLSADFALQMAGDQLYFSDGPRVNELRGYRIRFIDRSGAARTYAGAPPFVGNGAHRQAVRSDVAGIAYKLATAPNQSAFPAGLYFADPGALVLGHVAADDHVALDWGNGANMPITLVTGTAVGVNGGLGVNYSAGGVDGIGFDNGLPWLRYGPDYNVGWLVSVDASRRVVARQSGFTEWELAADGSDPAMTQLWPYGALSNIDINDGTAVLLGGYDAYTPTATIRVLDFTSSKVTRVMGAGANGFTADRTTPGTVTTASLSSSCVNSGLRCFTEYDPAQDRIYFSEDNRLRYITTPFNGATATLITLFAEPSNQDVQNFTLRPGGTQVFYLSNGTLRCFDTGGAPMCDGRDLGPPPLFGGVNRGPNQLTWRDANTLLLSTYNGIVLEYAVP